MLNVVKSNVEKTEDIKSFFRKTDVVLYVILALTGVLLVMASV